MRSLRCFLFAACCAAAVPAAVMHTPHEARAADDKAVAEAKARFKEGLARVEKKDYEGARLAFVQAYAVIKSTDILFNLALMEELTGHPVDAIIHFRAIVRDKTVTEKDRATARKHIDDVAKVTGHIEITAPAGWNVFVDGAAWGTTPLFEPIDVAPGKHKVEVRTPDKGYEMSVDAPQGEVKKANFVDMIASGQTAPAPSASAAPAPSAPAPTATASADVGVPAPPSGGFWTTRNIVVIGLGVGALAAVGGGIAFGAMSSSDSDKASTLRAQQGSSGCFNSSSQACSDSQSAVDSSKSERTTSTILYVGGGVLAAGAIAAFVFWPKAKEQSAWRVVPVVGHGVAGVSAAGHF